MKNKTLRYTSLSALALLAVLTLAACGGNTEKTTASSSKEASSKVTNTGLKSKNIL